MDPNARVRRNRGALSESRAAGQQGQDSGDRKDSTDFHCNVASGPKTNCRASCDNGRSVEQDELDLSQQAEKESFTRSKAGCFRFLTFTQCFCSQP